MASKFAQLFGGSDAAPSRFDEVFGQSGAEASAAYQRANQAARDSFGPNGALTDLENEPGQAPPGATPMQRLNAKLAREQAERSQRHVANRIAAQDAAAAAQEQRDGQAGSFADYATNNADGGIATAPDDVTPANAEQGGDPLGTRMMKMLHQNWGMFKQQAAGLVTGSIENAPRLATAAVMPAGNPLWDWLNAPYTSRVEAMRKQGALPGQKLYADAQADITANQYDFDGKGDYYVQNALDSVIQMVPTVAAAFLTRGQSLEAEGAAAAGAGEAEGGNVITRFLSKYGDSLKENRVSLSVLAGQQGAQQYEQSRQSGRSVGESDTDALVFGIAEALPEGLELDVLMKPGGRFLPRLLKSAGMEGASEALTQAIETGYQVGVLHQNMTWAQARQSMVDAGIIGFGMGASLGAGSHALHHGFQAYRSGGAAAPGAGAAPDVGEQPEPPMPGMVEQAAAAGAEAITPDDHASPLPTDLIAQGKAAMAAASATGHASDILAQAGIPGIGSRVSINMGGGQVHTGQVDDAFTTTDPQFGENHGVRIRLDSGGVFEEYLNTLRDAGVSIQTIDDTLNQIEAANPQPAATRAAPSPADPLGRMVDITLGSESRGHDLSAGGGVLTSPAGAKGRMQVLDGTNSDPGYGVRPAQDDSLAERARVGRDYLAALMSHYGNDPAKAWAAYNWGPGHLDAAIRQHGDDWLDHAPAETQAYVRKNVAQLGGAAAAPAAAAVDDTTDRPDEQLPGGDQFLQEPVSQVQFGDEALPQPDLGEAAPPAAAPEGDGTRAAPIRVTDASHMEGLDVAAPTPAQAETGNYKKAHVQIQGLNITVENPRGSERSGLDPDGKPWSVTMPASYGYVKRTVGADDEQVDVYVGAHPYANRVYVVDQADHRTGQFDEHKAMIGFPTEAAALDTYRQGFSDGNGDRRIGGVQSMTMDEFKSWLSTSPETPATQGEHGSQIPVPAPSGIAPASEAQGPGTPQPLPETRAPEASQGPVSIFSTSQAVPKIDTPQPGAPTSAAIGAAGAPAAEPSSPGGGSHIVPFASAQPGDVVNEHGATLIRGGFATTKQLGVWAKSNRVEMGGANAPLVESYPTPQGTRFALTKRAEEAGLPDATQEQTPPAVAASDNQNATGLIAPAVGHVDRDHVISGARGADVEDLLARAAVNQTELGRIGADLGREVGVVFKDPGTKSPERVREKIANEGYSDPGEIKDMARGAFIVTERGQGQKIVDALAARFPIHDKGWEPFNGYLDRKVIVRFPNGGVAEIQIVPKQVFDYKKAGGNALYKLVRDPATSDAETAAALVKMKAGYEAALEGSDFAALGKVDAKAASASSDPSTSVLRTSEGEAGDHLPPSNTNPELKSDTATGRSSSSNSLTGSTSTTPDMGVKAGPGKDVHTGEIERKPEVPEAPAAGRQGDHVEAAPPSEARAGEDDAPPPTEPKQSIAEPEKSVAVLTGDELGVAFHGREDMPALRDAAARYYTREYLGKSVTTADGRVVRFNGRGLRKVTSKGETLLRAVPAIRPILEQGSVIESRPGQDRGTKAMHLYAAPVEIAGRQMRLAVFVRETADGDFQYDLTNIDVAAGAGMNPEGRARENLVAPASDSAPGDNLNIMEIPATYNIGRRDISAVRAALQNRLGQLGLSGKTSLEVVDRLFGDSRIAGQYADRVISVALNAAQDPAITLDHEAIHGLRDLGLFKPAEWTALRNGVLADPGQIEATRSRYAGRNLSDDAIVEEAVADRFAAWAAGRRQERGFIQAAFQRVRDFVKALGEALRGRFTTAESVMRAIDTGAIGGRAATGEAAGQEAGAQLSVTPHQFEALAPQTVTAGGAGGGGAGGYTTATPAFNDPETEKRWQDAAKGVGDGPGMVAQAKGWWSDVAAGFTRHWRSLPNEPRFADLQQQFRKLEAAPQAAKERTVRLLKDVVGDMSKADLDLFTRKVVLDDLTWEAGEEHQLPFGFTPETLAVEKAKIDRLIDADPKLRDAVRRRKLVTKQIADEMVGAGVLDREQIRNPAYFRHMVLDYARAEMRLAHGAGNKVKSPYWAKRMGSSLDINANLLEAEFEWLQKAQVDVATAKLIDWLKTSDHNVRESLRAQAKALNDEALGKALGRDAPASAQAKELGDTIGAGLSQVRLAAENDELGEVPAHLQPGLSKLDIKGVGDESAIPLLAWILDNNKPGAPGAAAVLKAYGQRKTFTKTMLGNAYLNTNDTPALAKRLAPEGYVAWQPIAGRHLFTAKTIPEHVLEGLVDRLSSPLVPGVPSDEMHRALSAVREQLVVGGERYTMVLPNEIAETLNEFGDRRAEGLFAAGVQQMQAAWKRWVLINPRRFLKYNINNMSGDLDALIAGNPGALRKVGAAAKELYAVMKNGAPPSARYQEAVERGVFDSGLSIQEIPDINRLSAFRHLADDHTSKRPDRLVVQAAANVWRALQGATQYRENIFRLASYLDYIEKIEAGRPTGYGASVPKMVDAIKDPKDRAALLARELVGDYGSVSASGNWLRRHLIPFWSWTEVNTRRYWRLTSNAWSQGAGKGIATGGGLALSMGVRKSATLLLRMGLTYGLISLWNWLLFDDEEKELGEQQRSQLHLILGRDSSGQVVTLRLQGALSDVLGEMGLPDAVIGLRHYLNGQGSIGEMLGDVAKAPINKVATGLNPMIGIPAEQALGKELWPDIFNPRDIRDRWRNVFQTFSLENEYDHVMQKPSRGYVRSWVDSVVYRRDPAEMAYDEAKSIAYDWLARERGESSTGSHITPRGDALRNYRMAIRYGDEPAAAKALAEYEKYGGTSRSFAEAVRAQHPLAPIAKHDRKAFLDSLTPEQYDTFVEAQRWYDETFLERREPPPSS